MQIRRFESWGHDVCIQGYCLRTNRLFMRIFKLHSSSIQVQAEEVKSWHWVRSGGTPLIPTVTPSCPPRYTPHPHSHAPHPHSHAMRFWHCYAVAASTHPHGRSSCRMNSKVSEWMENAWLMIMQSVYVFFRICEVRIELNEYDGFRHLCSQGPLPNISEVV